MDSIERLINLRDSLTDAWVTLDRSKLQEFETIFARINGDNKSILEVGSGFGLTCILYALLVAKEVHGVELIERAVLKAKELRDTVNPNLPVFFKQHDAAHPLPFPDEKFDALLLIEVISHVIVPDFHAFLVE